MKKIFSIIMALAISSAMMLAQESNRDANGMVQFGPYETNSFLSNWFVEVGAGVQGPVDRANGNYTYDFGGLAVNANIGKWFDPCYGVRVGWQGLTNGNITNKTTFKESFDGNHAFNYVHGDFFVNFSNLVAGYKETRGVDVVPFLTAGAMFNKEHRALALGCGIESPIRLSNVVKIAPQVQVLATNSNVIGGSGVVLQPSASVNVIVNLGKNNWTRKATTVAEYTGLVNNAKEAEAVANGQLANVKAQCDRLFNTTEALKMENGRLYKALAEAKEVKAPKFDDFAVYFDMGKAVLSERELVHLDYCANAIIKANSKVKFYVSGGADSLTGSQKRNTELCKQRAEYICNLLSEKYGVTNIEQVEAPVFDRVPSAAFSRLAIISVE